MPLSEYEQKVLDELEQQLASEDPKLADEMAGAKGVGPSRRGRVAAGILVGLVGVAVLLLGMLMGQIWVALIGFAVMFGGTVLALSKPKAAKVGGAPQGRGAAGPKPAKGQHGSISGRLEDRWEHRQEGR
ncbi:MAG: DUF3040 domain-containing protein [Bifidobacteriaceae bacterium]|nr:DUF3040 domain-containing protein [Bifidobacteriaceae bacterium]